MPNPLEHAIKIIKKLQKAGFKAYFAGGWVRDFLLKHSSYDIDIATNAPPNVILDLFDRTIHVGIAFGVIVVASGSYQFEVASFRRDVSYSNGRQPDSVELATAEEDAQRRDFTINGMFYDPIEEVIHDYIDGQRDLRQGIIRTIGDPFERFQEDRLRMIRAVRFAARLGFTIDADTQEAIIAVSNTLLPAVAMERIWQELTKMARSPLFEWALIEMHRFGLLQMIFPTLENVHLHDIKIRVAPLSLYPNNFPPILSVAQLFPNTLLEELLEIFGVLRVTNAEKRWLVSWSVAKETTKKEMLGITIGREEWTRLYANPHSEICLKLLSLNLLKEERETFISRHTARQQELLPHSMRIREKTPLVTAAHLLPLGIVPGRDMGIWLKRAESIAIEENLSDVEAVLKRLSVES